MVYPNDGLPIRKMWFFHIIAPLDLDSTSPRAQRPPRPKVTGGSEGDTPEGLRRDVRTPRGRGQSAMMRYQLIYIYIRICMCIICTIYLCIYIYSCEKRVCWSEFHPQMSQEFVKFLSFGSEIKFHICRRGPSDGELWRILTRGRFSSCNFGGFWSAVEGEVWPRKEKARSNRCWFGSPVALVCSSDLGDLTLLERLDFHCPPQSLVLCPMCRNSLNQLPSGRRYVWIPSVMDHDHVETWTLKSCRMVMHVGGRTEWAESSEKWKSYGVVCFLATLLLDKPIFWIVLRCIVPRQNNRDRWSRTENLREYNLPHARQSTWETERRGASPKCASQHWKLIRIRIYNDISYYIMVFYVYCTVYLRLEIFQHHHFSWTFAQTQFQDRCVDGVQDIQKGKLDEVCPSWKSQNAFLALMRRWHPMAQRLWKPEGFNRLGIFLFIKDIELLS